MVTKIASNPFSLDAFFYPLDRITNWNDIYGKSGFTQYQFIFPKQISFDGISEVLTKIHHSNYIPFLAVLKLYGKENNNDIIINILFFLF